MDKQGIIDASKKRREGERIFYTSCPANGCWDSACVLKCHMKDGKIFAIEPDDSINKNDSREDKAWEPTRVDIRLDGLLQGLVSIICNVSRYMLHSHSRLERL